MPTFPPLPSPSSSLPAVLHAASSSSSWRVAVKSTVANDSSWGPYASPSDFKGNALIILSIVFCSVLLFLAFNSIIRFLFCAGCTSTTTDNSSSNARGAAEDEKPKDTTISISNSTPALLFSKEISMMGMSECAICLSEFAEGDGVRILPACNHGFHAQCLDTWLALRCSCPTCRASALVVTDSS